ncbi:MAG TPA: phospholipase D-like domain-containing protein [Nitrospiria bacterium]|nr:phospholipase D-like domain-containing protein [Nitrospiria bacterium]
MNTGTDRDVDVEARPPMRERRASDRAALATVRAFAQQAFSRAAGAPLIEGNSVRLLKDARENYPAWLAAISAATRHVYFENYIISDDDTGRAFADALLAKAREGVRVRVLYDWLGCWGKTSGRFWKRLRAGGVEVRCYNPPRFDSPFGWINRDHRKLLAVDGRVGFVSGLCVGRPWVGDPDRGMEPWRDTGVEVRGPAVADMVHAFADVWATTGAPLPHGELASLDAISAAGDTALRVVASLPNTAGMLRLDQFVAALAKERLWLTDPYYAGTTPFTQGLCTAVNDGVDVRLLVPGATDVPLVRPLSRAGYRPLLEGGVRVFEWNGPMMHAKTSTADGRWARVGSTNLNIASWLGNCELDVVVEDERFAREMEEMYLDDLSRATELVLDERQRVRAPNQPRRRLMAARGGGSAGRAATGMLRLGNVVGASLTNRRVLEPVESRLMATTGALLLAVAMVFAVFPRVLAYPLIAVGAWLAVTLLVRGYRLRLTKKTGGPRDADDVGEPRPSIDREGTE